MLEINASDSSAAGGGGGEKDQRDAAGKAKPAKEDMIVEPFFRLPVFSNAVAVASANCKVAMQFRTLLHQVEDLVREVERAHLAVLHEFNVEVDRYLDMTFHEAMVEINTQLDELQLYHRQHQAYFYNPHHENNDDNAAAAAEEMEKERYKCNRQRYEDEKGRICMDTLHRTMRLSTMLCAIFDGYEDTGALVKKKLALRQACTALSSFVSDSPIDLIATQLICFESAKRKTIMAECQSLTKYIQQDFAPQLLLEQHQQLQPYKDDVLLASYLKITELCKSNSMARLTDMQTHAERILAAPNPVHAAEPKFRELMLRIDALSSHFQH